MEGKRQSPDLEELERRVGELEEITDSLGSVADEDLVQTLDRAVVLLREINASIESRIRRAGDEARGVDTLLDGVDFGPFDEAMEEFGGQASGGTRWEPGGPGR